MRTHQEPGTGFVEETEIVWTRVVGVLAAFALLIGAIYWMFGGTSEEASEAGAGVEQQSGSVATLEASSDENTSSVKAIEPAAAPATAEQPAQAMESAPAATSAPVARTPEPVAEQAAEPAASNQGTTMAKTAEATQNQAPPAAAKSAAPTNASSASSSAPSKAATDGALHATTHESHSAEPKVNQQQTVNPKLVKGSYTVRPKETLKSIAERLYGDRRKWIYLAEVNPGLKPNALPVEEQIRLPNLPVLEKRHRSEWQHLRGGLQKAGAGGKSITVHPGENLSILANRAYGNSAKWHVIADANKDKISDPAKLEVGTELLIPALPKQ